MVFGGDKGQVCGLGGSVLHRCSRGQGGTKTVGMARSAPGPNLLFSPVNLRVVPAEPGIS